MQTKYQVSYTKQYSDKIETKIITCESYNFKSLVQEVNKLKGKECLYDDNIIGVLPLKVEATQ